MKPSSRRVLLPVEAIQVAGLVVVLYLSFLRRSPTSRTAEILTPAAERSAEVSTPSAAGSPRILCWILTSPENLMRKARHAGATWGRRCDRLLYMSSEPSDELEGVVALNVSADSRDTLWGKTKLAFTYLSEHHIKDADWFFKADDDTYVLVDNLRLLLTGRDPNQPAYLGCNLDISGHMYASGGAGYVLSRAAVSRFAEMLSRFGNKCQPNGQASETGAEDFFLGRCLARIGVALTPTRDANGRERFHPHLPEAHLWDGDRFQPRPMDLAWYARSSKTIYRVPSEACCSDTAVSFHYVRPERMYEFEYLIYRLSNS